MANIEPSRKARGKRLSLKARGFLAEKTMAAEAGPRMNPKLDKAAWILQKEKQGASFAILFRK